MDRPSCPAANSETVDVLVPCDGRPVHSGLLILSSTGGDLRMVTADYRCGYTRVLVSVEPEKGAWCVTGVIEQVEASELHAALCRSKGLDEDECEDDEQVGLDPDELDEPNDV